MILPIVALSIEPVNALIEVEYIRTINGDEVVVKDPYGEELTIHLLGISAEPISNGTPEAYAAAAEIAELLSEAHEVFLEAADPEGKHANPVTGWLWFTVEHGDGQYERKLVNAELLRTGSFRLVDSPKCDVYRDELLATAAVEQTAQDGDPDTWVWRPRVGVEPLGYFTPGTGKAHKVMMRNSCVVTHKVENDKPGTWIKVKRSTDEAFAPYPMEVMDDGKVVAYFDLVNVSQNHLTNIGVQLDYMNKDGRAFAMARSGVLNLGPGDVRRIAVVVEKLDMEQLQFIVY